MAAYAILRTEKLKNAASIRGAGGHNARTRETPNANPTGEIVALVDPGWDVYDAVMAKIKTAGITPRKNAVLAQEILLTASPEYFRPDAPEKFGYWDEERLMQWRKRAEKWLLDQFGDNVVSAYLHLDEATPHIQAIVVPITDDGRLSARDLFNRKTLKQYQDSYAEALSDLGIKRGIKGSKAKHRKIRQFYQLAESRTPDPPRVPTPPPMVREAPRQEWAEEQNRKIQQLTEQLHAQSQALELARRREREMRQTLERNEAEMEKLREERQRLIEEMRSIPIPQVLDALGLTHNKRHDKNQWIGDGHRINVESDRVKWFDHVQGQGGGGAIDLVMHCLGCGFKEALGWLSDTFGAGEAAAALRAEADQVVKRESRPRPFKLPPQDDAAWPVVRKWLIEERGIPESTADRLHERGLVYATRRGRYVNAVFPGQSKRPPQIAELKGTGGDFTGLAAGSNKDRDWFQIRAGRGDLRRLVLVESALDAISYALLHRDTPTRVVSTAGVRPDHPILKWALAKGLEVVCAYDADEAGEKIYQALKERYMGLIGREKPPHGKDWNDVLQRQARRERGEDARQESHQGPML